MLSPAAADIYHVGTFVHLRGPGMSPPQSTQLCIAVVLSAEGGVDGDGDVPGCMPDAPLLALLPPQATPIPAWAPGCNVRPCIHSDLITGCGEYKLSCQWVVVEQLAELARSPFPGPVL
jgi:hypothetical protein